MNKLLKLINNICRKYHLNDEEIDELLLIAKDYLDVLLSNKDCK